MTSTSLDTSDEFNSIKHLSTTTTSKKPLPRPPTTSFIAKPSPLSSPSSDYSHLSSPSSEKRLGSTATADEDEEETLLSSSSRLFTTSPTTSSPSCHSSSSPSTTNSSNLSPKSILNEFPLPQTCTQKESNKKGTESYLTPPPSSQRSKSNYPLLRTTNDNDDEDVDTDSNTTDESPYTLNSISRSYYQRLFSDALPPLPSPTPSNTDASEYNEGSDTVLVTTTTTTTTTDLVQVVAVDAKETGEGQTEISQEKSTPVEAEAIEVESEEVNSLLLAGMSPLFRSSRRPSLTPSPSPSPPSSGGGRSIIELSEEELRIRNLERRIVNLIRRVEGLELEIERERMRGVGERLEERGIDLNHNSVLILSNPIESLTICPYCGSVLPLDSIQRSQSWQTNHWNCLKEIEKEVGGVVVLDRNV